MAFIGKARIMIVCIVVRIPFNGRAIFRESENTMFHFHLWTLFISIGPVDDKNVLSIPIGMTNDTGAYTVGEMIHTTIVNAMPKGTRTTFWFVENTKDCIKCAEAEEMLAAYDDVSIYTEAELSMYSRYDG